jgi:beta-glucosidase
LRGFQKVHLAVGESKTVEFLIDATTLGYYAADGRWLMDRAKYDLWISDDSASGTPAQFSVK